MLQVVQVTSASFREGFFHKRLMTYVTYIINIYHYVDDNAYSIMDTAIESKSISARLMYILSVCCNQWMLSLLYEVEIALIF